MAVKIKFLGGVRTVTGSSHLVSSGCSQILLDAGLFHGRRDEAYNINTTFAYNPHKVDALVLSHAHIDHCGNIPNVIKKGLRCKIYTTSATKDLAKLMLEDSGKIQEEDVHYVNKINKRQGLPLRKPLYTRREAIRATKQFRMLYYGQKFRLARDIFATLLDAGHILGSSIVVLEVQDAGQSIKIGYAVDLGRKDLPLLNDPVIPCGLDYLIIETTYGDREHSPMNEAKGRLADVIRRTYERKGKIIIPSFALERTQEVLYFLNEIFRDKSAPRMPIYVDSPLASDVTEVFKNHLDFFDAETQLRISQGNSPFEFLQLRYVRSTEESKRLNDDNRPMIIISGSGMCESGRVLHHLRNNIEDSRNTVLVVGYMAQDTLGKRIVDKQKFVRIFGVEHELNAEVVVINAFSGHADKNELLDFVRACLPLKRVFLVHGDLDQCEAFAGVLSQQGLNVYIPGKGEEVLLE